MTEGPVQGDPADLAEMVKQVERRNSVLVRLAGGVERLSHEVRDLRRDIEDRPTKQNVAARRRRSFAALLIYGVLIIWAHDEHVEACSPGSTALAVVEDLAARQNLDGVTAKTLRDALSEQPTEWCDATFPLHHHGSGLKDADPAFELFGWEPTQWNVIGFLGYGSVGGMLYLWARDPRRPRRRR